MCLAPRLHCCTVFFHAPTAPCERGRSNYRGISIPLGHTTLGTTSLDEWSARHRDLYLTTHNTEKRQTSMSPVGFEPAIPSSERSQSHSLDRAAAVISCYGRFDYENKQRLFPQPAFNLWYLLWRPSLFFVKATEFWIVICIGFEFQSVVYPNISHIGVHYVSILT
jgi:hypothetical protein